MSNCEHINPRNTNPRNTRRDKFNRWWRTAVLACGLLTSADVPPAYGQQPLYTQYLPMVSETSCPRSEVPGSFQYGMANITGLSHTDAGALACLDENDPVTGYGLEVDDHGTVLNPNVLFVYAFIRLGESPVYDRYRQFVPPQYDGLTLVGNECHDPSQCDLPPRDVARLIWGVHQHTPHATLLWPNSSQNATPAEIASVLESMIDQAPGAQELQDLLRQTIFTMHLYPGVSARVVIGFTPDGEAIFGEQRTATLGDMVDQTDEKIRGLLIDAVSKGLLSADFADQYIRRYGLSELDCVTETRCAMARVFYDAQRINTNPKTKIVRIIFYFPDTENNRPYYAPFIRGKKRTQFGAYMMGMKHRNGVGYPPELTLYVYPDGTMDPPMPPSLP